MEQVRMDLKMVWYVHHHCLWQVGSRTIYVMDLKLLIFGNTNNRYLVLDSRTEHRNMLELQSCVRSGNLRIIDALTPSTVILKNEITQVPLLRKDKSSRDITHWFVE